MRVGHLVRPSEEELLVHALAAVATDADQLREGAHFSRLTSQDN
jgi:hypothetical protein